MLVKKAFQTANHRIGLGVAWKAHRESGLTGVLGPNEGKDDKGEAFSLVLPVLREVHGESGASRSGGLSKAHSVVACQTPLFKLSKTVGL